MHTGNAQSLKTLIASGDRLFEAKDFYSAERTYKMAFELSQDNLELLKKYVNTCNKATEMKYAGAPPDHYTKWAITACNVVENAFAFNLTQSATEEHLQNAHDVVLMRSSLHELLGDKTKHCEDQQKLKATKRTLDLLRSKTKSLQDALEKKKHDEKKQEFIKFYKENVIEKSNPKADEAAHFAYEGAIAANTLQNQQAIEWLTKAISLCNNDYRSRMLRGFVYIRLGKYQEAKDEANYCLKECNTGYFLRGIADHYLGNKDGARMDLMEGAKEQSFIKEKNFHALEPDQLLMVMRILNNIEPDIKSVVLVEAKASSVYSLEKQADTLIESKQWEQAVKKLNEAISLDLTDYTYYTRRARAFAEIGKINEAIEDYTIAIFLNHPHNPKYKGAARLEYIRARKQLHLDNDNYPLAVMDMCIEANIRKISDSIAHAEFSSVLYLKAKKHLRHKSLLKARFWLIATIKFNPKNLNQYIDELSDIQDQQIKLEAIKIIRQFEALNPQPPTTKENEKEKPTSRKKKYKNKKGKKPANFPPVRRVPATTKKLAQPEDITEPVNQEAKTTAPAQQPLKQSNKKGLAKKLRRLANKRAGIESQAQIATLLAEQKAKEIEKAESERNAALELLAQTEKEKAARIDAQNQRIQTLKMDEEKAQATPITASTTPVEHELDAKQNPMVVAKICLDKPVKEYLRTLRNEKTLIKGSYGRIKILKKPLASEKDIDFVTRLKDQELVLREPLNHECKYIPGLYQHIRAGRKFETSISTNEHLLKDALQADFTIGGIFVEYEDKNDDGEDDKEGNEHGLVYDPTGMGLMDLQQRVLRTPMPTRQTFINNPILMLRAIYFHVSEGMTIPDEMDNAIYMVSDMLLTIPPGRLNSWFFKIFSSKNGPLYFSQMMPRGIFDRLFPALPYTSLIQDWFWINMSIGYLYKNPGATVQDVYLIFIVSAVMYECTVYRNFMFSEQLIKSIIENNIFFKACFGEEYPKEPVQELQRSWKFHHKQYCSFYLFQPTQREPGALHQQHTLHAGMRVTVSA